MGEVPVVWVFMVWGTNSVNGHVHGVGGHGVDV